MPARKSAEGENMESGVENNETPPLISCPTVHVLNSKTIGGTGKSTTCRTMCDYYDRHGKQRTLVDADKGRNVAKNYDKDNYARWETRGGLEAAVGGSFLDMLIANSQQGASQENNGDLLDEQIIFSDRADRAYLGERAMELISTSGKDTLISLPANDDFCHWLDEMRVDRIVSDPNPPFTLVNWWCSYGCTDSQHFFIEFVDRYPNLKHVLLFNKGISTRVPDWSRYKDIIPKVIEYHRARKIKVAFLQPFPHLPKVAPAIESGLTYQEIGDRLLNRIERLKVEEWLEENWKEFKETGYFG